MATILMRGTKVIPMEFVKAVGRLLAQGMTVDEIKNLVTDAVAVQPTGREPFDEKTVSADALAKGLRNGTIKPPKL